MFKLEFLEWSTAVIESAANWTIAANTAGHDGYWSLYTQDSIHLNDEMPFMNHEGNFQLLLIRGLHKNSKRDHSCYQNYTIKVHLVMYRP